MANFPALHFIFALTFLLLGSNWMHPCLVQGAGIYCDLTWPSFSIGDEIPSTAIDSGNGDFVSRVKESDGSYQPGRFSPSDEKTYYTFRGVAKETTVFDLLVNSEECTVAWLDFDGLEPIDASIQVPVQHPTSGLFMGRGDHSNLTIGGRIEGQTLFIAYLGQEIELVNNFQVLTSTYPLLNVKLTHFKWDIGGMTGAEIEGSTKKMLFGIEEIQNSVNVTLRQSVVHSDTFEEEFLLSEPGQEWQGLSNVELALKTWFGGPIITDSFDAEGQLSSVTIRRSREVTVEREFEIMSETNVQICSISVILVDKSIGWSAIMEISKDEMSEAKINYILQETGRPILGSTKDVVKAEIKGQMTGEYLIRTTSVSSNIDEDGACSSMY